MSSLSIPSVLPGALATLEPQVRADVVQQLVGVGNVPLDGNVVMFARGVAFWAGLMIAGSIFSHLTEDKRFEIFQLLSDSSMSLNLYIFTLSLVLSIQ